MPRTTDTVYASLSDRAVTLPSARTPGARHAHA